MTAHALAEPAASAARTGSRDIAVHLTGFAPDCERIAIHSPRRWRTFWASLPEPVLRSLLSRLNRAPRAIAFNTQVNGDLEILGDVAPEVAGLISSAAKEPVVLAIVFDGLAEDEARAALRALIAADWLPPKLAAVADDSPLP